MARIRYYYDTESCKFEKSGFTWKGFLFSGVSHIIIGAFVTAAFGSLLFYGIDNPEHQQLRGRILDLKGKAYQFENRIDALAEDLKDIQSLDGEFHKNVLKMDVQSPTSLAFGEPSAPPSSSQETVPGNVTDLSQQLNELDEKIRNQTSHFIALEEKLREKGNNLRNVPSIRPVNNPLVSGFGQRKHPLLKIEKKHQGMDFAAAPGTPVVATADGVIKFSGTSANGYGIHVDINHGFGFESRYAHLSKVTVAEGKRVSRGDIIGYSGNTGLVKGPHLHYEILINGKNVDPVDYFYTDLGPEEYVEFKRLAGLSNESMD